MSGSAGGKTESMRRVTFRVYTAGKLTTLVQSSGWTISGSDAETDGVAIGVGV